MTYTGFGRREPSGDLGDMQDKLDRAFPESDDEEASLFGAVGEEDPEHVSTERGGLIDLSKLDKE